MGNQLAVAGAQSKLDSTLNDIGQAFGKNEEDKKGVGCANKKDMEQRRKLREEEYLEKQRQRSERKEKISAQWAAHKQKHSSG